MSFEMTNDVHVTIVVNGQDSAKTLWMAIDYAVNNSPNLTNDQKLELGPVRDDLASVFDL